MAKGKVVRICIIVKHLMNTFYHHQQHVDSTSLKRAQAKGTKQARRQ